MKNLANKIILCSSITALLVFGLTVSAQKTEPEGTEPDVSRIELGVRFMPTFSSFDMQTSEGGVIQGKVTLGYGFGGFLGYNFSNNIGIQGEVIYSSISRKYTEMDMERKIVLRYLNIPLLLSLNSGKSRIVNLNIVAGPQIGILVGSRVYTSGGDGTTLPQPLLLVKKADLGIAYGAGLDFALNTARTFRFGLGFRGVLGLIDISNNSETKVTDSYYILDRTNVKTYSAYFGLSVLF